jgi:hypothetical protein
MMTYKFRDMVMMMFLGMIIGVAIVGAVIVDANGATAHECVAPCTVVLPKGTLEDEFGINYGWRNSRTPILDVWGR